jgi:hypothetical protein
MAQQAAILMSRKTLKFHPEIVAMRPMGEQWSYSASGEQILARSEIKADGANQDPAEPESIT